MAEFTLRLRRYDPESGRSPYWADYVVDLEPHRSVLEGILQAKNEQDGSIGIRCSCRAAICGSCGVMINGRAGLACHTHLDAARKGGRDGVIEVEPFNNMPVLKDLIVVMDAGRVVETGTYAELRERGGALAALEARETTRQPGA